MPVIRAAIASRDGKVVNEHFGRAEKFHIVELDGSGYKYIEERPVEKCCKGGEHEDSAFDKAAEILRDCKAIVVLKIGYDASNYMESLGFELFEAGMTVDDALEKLNKYYFERGEFDGGNI